MRFISQKTGGYRIYAVSGVNTISFAIDFDEANTKGLLGFAVERHDITENERYYMYGFKVFRELIPRPKPDMLISTFDYPVQSIKTPPTRTPLAAFRWRQLPLRRRRPPGSECVRRAAAS